MFRIGVVSNGSLNTTEGGRRGGKGNEGSVEDRCGWQRKPEQHGGNERKNIGASYMRGEAQHQGMYIQENRASATYPSIAPPVSSGISSNWRISRALRPSKNSSIGSSTCNVISKSCSKSSNIYIDSSKREPQIAFLRKDPH